MAWMALALLGLILAAAPMPEAQPLHYPAAGYEQYPVGGSNANPNWFPQPSFDFYQKWADQVTLYVNESLRFQFDTKSHDVTQLWSDDFVSCSIANRAAYAPTPGDFRIIFPDVGTFYYTSSGKTITNTSADCVQGMRFSIKVLSRDLSPSPSPSPDPLHNSPPPPPPPGPSPNPDTGGSSNTDLGTKGKGKTFPVEAVAVPTAVVISIVVLALVGYWYYRRQYGFKPRGRSASAAIHGILQGNAARLTTGTIFTYAELDQATNSFSEDKEVGRGGFGTVYKGTLDDGRTVAIKMAKHANVVESFVNEVAILSQVNNRNLVKLLGCCIDRETPLLVYEFVPNGTLREHLFIEENGFDAGLDWNTRFRIALQTAEALKYLHIQATPPIFHRDVKSANILLDNDFNGKVADFGFSKLVDLDATHVSTLVKGTPGYLDPEYHRNCQLTDKSDVYSFGVVLLELITSKKPMDHSKPDGEQNLALSSIPLIKSGRVREIIDSRMSSKLSVEEFHVVEEVAQVAVACLGSSRASRPSMSEVVEMLQRIKGSKLKAEEFYSKVGVADCEDRIIEVQACAILVGDSGSPIRETSSSDY